MLFQHESLLLHRNRINSGKIAIKGKSRDVLRLGPTGPRASATMGTTSCFRLSLNKRKIRRASRPGKQFNLVIDEEPLDRADPRVSAALVQTPNVPPPRELFIF
ncbi:hypothetical protein TNCV_323342 [Trichonephila clavipes]|nr:hypothetical protein TNCV_323342 [Trichonephila clavipes]